MTSTELERLIREKLEAAGLLGVLDEFKSQFMEFPDGLFAELVLDDGSKLVDAERIGRELRESLRKQGVDLDVIVRANWTIEGIGDLQVGMGLASIFPVTLVSGVARTVVKVAIPPPVVLAIRSRLRVSSGGPPDELAVMKEAVREFLDLELALGGESYWDPKRNQDRELSEAALDYLFLTSAAGKK